MKSVVIVCVLLTICIVSTNAITCYHCVYYEGHPNSDDECRNKPSSDRTCRTAMMASNSSLSLSVRNGYTLNETEYDQESRQDWTQLCSKFTGDMNGKSVIARGCATGIRELAGQCTNNAWLEVEGRNASNVRACFCTSDRCNSAPVVAITYLSMVAVAIHVIFKFV